MNAKMYSLLWILSIVAMFVADVRTGALQQKDLSPRRCYHCGHNNTSCQPGVPVLCPVGQPFCATVASAPNFTSRLICSAGGAGTGACSLKLTTGSSLQLRCLCADHLCNAPYSTQLQNELINFATQIPANNTELTEAFLKSSAFANVNSSELYKAITKASDVTDKPLNKFTIGSLSTGDTEDVLPRAEALKHEATVPPDDDEDEGEGSGAYEESKTQAAPAAPSSFLPEEENNASVLLSNLNLLLATLSLSSFTVL